MLRTQFIGFARAAVLAVASIIALAQPSNAQLGFERLNQEHVEFTIDVAEDMAKFVETRVKPTDPEPLRGSFFITEGRIFPAYAIPNNNSAAEFDPNGPGSFGTWFCKGTFLVPGSQFDKENTAVLTDQLYLLNDDKRSIATTGIEGNGVAVRPVIGGTGVYAGYVGEQRQQFLGFNKSGGVNLRVTITLRKASNFR